MLLTITRGEQHTPIVFHIFITLCSGDVGTFWHNVSWKGLKESQECNQNFLNLILFSSLKFQPICFPELAFCWDVEKSIYYIPEFWSLLDYCIAFCLHLEKWIVTGKSDKKFTKAPPHFHLYIAIKPCISESTESSSHSVVSNSLWHHGL